MSKLRNISLAPFNLIYVLVLYVLIIIVQTKSNSSHSTVMASQPSTSPAAGSAVPTKGSNSSQSSIFAIRLHLIRHGETEANQSHLVLGQSDSPLTQNGTNQAKAANSVIGRYPFWRRYTSDLKRAHDTANIILGLSTMNGSNRDEQHELVVDKIDNGPFLIIDERLRERAKGARELKDKSLTYDEAMEIFKNEQIAAGRHDESSWDLPKLETEDEVWIRLQSWIKDVIMDAYTDYVRFGNNKQYDVFALTHSGTLRIIIERMVGKQLPDNLSNEETEKNGVITARLRIPNTSITRIDLYPDLDDDDNDDNGEWSSSSGSDGQPFDFELPLRFGNDATNVSWKAKLVELTNSLHIDGEESKAYDE